MDLKKVTSNSLIKIFIFTFTALTQFINLCSKVKNLYLSFMSKIKTFQNIENKTISFIIDMT